MYICIVLGRVILVEYSPKDVPVLLVPTTMTDEVTVALADTSGASLLLLLLLDTQSCSKRKKTFKKHCYII